MKLIFLLATLGHVLCAVSDYLFSKTPQGLFKPDVIKDGAKMEKTFLGMNPNQIMVSMILGVSAICLFAFGYSALCRYVANAAPIFAKIMYISCVAHFVFAAVFHVICGVVEWFYVKLERTKIAYAVVTEFFTKSNVIAVVCYVTIAIFLITFFLAVVLGKTPLPKWACVFNAIPFFVILSPFKLVGSGNIASALMFLALTFFV